MGGGQIVVELIEHHQIAGLLQTAQSIKRSLQQQHVSLSQHHPSQAIAQGAVGPVHRQHRGIEALAKAQLTQRGTGQQRARRHQHFGMADVGQLFGEQGAG